MARLNARWENFTDRGQTWDHFWQDAATAAASSTLAVAVTQAAASPSAALREDFRLAVAVTQAAASPTAALRERFLIAVAISQAPAVVSATTRERFLLSIAPTQAAASVTATVAEHFRLAAAVAQAAATPSASLTAAQGHPSLAVGVTQATAIVAASVTVPVVAATPAGGGALRPAVRQLNPRRMAAGATQSAASVAGLVHTHNPARVAVTQAPATVAVLTEQYDDIGMALALAA